MKTRADIAHTTVLQRISTFEETMEATKIISRAIADGLLDDAGDVAEITPEEFMIDFRDGRIVGVVVSIRSSEPMMKGVFRSGRFVREPADTDGTVRAFTRRRRTKAVLESRMILPAA